MLSSTSLVESVAAQHDHAAVESPLVRRWRCGVLDRSRTRGSADPAIDRRRGAVAVFVLTLTDSPPTGWTSNASMIATTC